MINPSLVIDKYLQIICDKVTESINLVESIILYGSYGRDEGSWYQDNEGNYQPYNDYDILLILDKKLPDNEIESLKEKLLEKIDIRWIDISQLTKIELTKLKPSIFNYDLKYASKVIYGDKNILDLISHIDASKLPLEEGNILFRTRMWTFLGSLNIDGFNKTLSGDKSRFFRNQMAKAILSIVDICLLQKGAYHYSYKERVKLFNKLFSHKQELCLLSEWALSEKLEPKGPNMSAKDVKNLYTKIHHLYIDEMFVALGKRFYTKITTPEKLVVLWKYYPINISRRIAYLLIKRSMQYEKSIILDMIQLYLLMAYNKEGFKNNYLLKANYLLKMLNNTINLDIAWDEARLIVAQMRLA